MCGGVGYMSMSGSVSKWITWDSPLSRQWRRRGSVSQSCFPSLYPIPTPHIIWRRGQALLFSPALRGRVPLHQARRGLLQPLFWQKEPPCSRASAASTVNVILHHRTYLFIMTVNARRRVWPLKLFLYINSPFPPPAAVYICEEITGIRINGRRSSGLRDSTTEMHGR